MRASASRAARARPRGWCYFCGVQWTCPKCRARIKALQADQDAFLRENVFPHLQDVLGQRSAEMQMFAGASTPVDPEVIATVHQDYYADLLRACTPPSGVIYGHRHKRRRPFGWL